MYVCITATQPVLNCGCYITYVCMYTPTVGAKNKLTYHTLLIAYCSVLSL